MLPATHPPIRNPLDLIAAKLHVTSNHHFFLQLANVLGGMVSHDHGEVPDSDRLKQGKNWPACTNPPRPRRRQPTRGDALLSGPHKTAK